MSDLLILAASALGVLAMVGAAMALGFRQRARVDEEALARIAAEENVRIEASVADAGGAAAVARLNDGRWLVARVMADGIGARVLAPSAVRVRATKQGLALRFDDLGYPGLRLRLEGAPPVWLMERAA